MVLLHKFLRFLFLSRETAYILRINAASFVMQFLLGALLQAAGEIVLCPNLSIQREFFGRIASCEPGTEVCDEIYERSIFMHAIHEHCVQ